MREHSDRASVRGARFSLLIGVAAVTLGMSGALPCSGQTGAGQAKQHLVVCAPGYPGSTLEAQPAMDALAEAVAAAAGWKEGELAAVYYETEKAGLARLAEPDATLALVPLTFWLKHRDTLKLVPHLQAIREGGEAAEAWSLVAAKGAVTGPSSLAGFDLLSLAGYAPRFVRGPALGSWGALPGDVKIVFSGAVLSGLRKAAAGEKVALLLDRAQAAALPTLPLAPQLEVVTSSPPLPVSVLCALGDRLPAARLAAILKVLPELGATPGGAAALAGVRLARFVPADRKSLRSAQDAYDRARD